MNNGSRARWDTFSQRFGPELAALLTGLTGDAALADGVVAEVLGAARAQVEAGAEPPGALPLQAAALRLVIGRLEERRQSVPLRLSAQVYTLSWPGPTPPDDPELVTTALTRLLVRERIALHLRLVKEYSIDDAADFFELTRKEFLRLLARARRRLLEEYQRLRDGVAAGVGLVVDRTLGTWRRIQAGITRTYGFVDQGLGRLASLPVLDAFSATATLALVAALTLGSAPAGLTPRTMSPTVLASGTIVAPRSESSLLRPDDQDEEATRPSVPSASTPAPTAAAAEESESPLPVAAAPPLPVAPVSKESGPEGRTTVQTEYSTLIHVGTEAPVQPPEDMSEEIPDQPVGVSVEVGYHCPPPDERPPPHAVACPVLEP